MSNKISTSLIFIFFCLSANVFGQFDYDSIALVLGYELEDHFTYSEEEMFLKKFNNEVFVSYVKIEEGDEKNPLKKQINKNLTEEDYGSLLYTEIQKSINSEDASYKFINYYVDELKNIYLTFRLYFDSGGINYHQYLLEPSGVAEYKITDLFVYLSGEYFSTTLQKVIYSVTGKAEDKIGPDNNESRDLAQLIEMAQIKKLYDQGQQEKARKKFYTIPEETRNSPGYLYLELSIVDMNDEEKYSVLMEKIVENANNGNATMHLVAIDYHYLNEDYDKVISSVDSLYDYTGDEFLEIYKGTAYWEMDSLEQAEKCFIKANDYYPSMPATYDYLLGLYEETGENQKFLNTVDTMSKYLMADYPIINNLLNKDYPDLISTPEYKAWNIKTKGIYQSQIDSLTSLLNGKWTFSHLETYDGSKMELTEFWEEGYGKVRPTYEFVNDKFTSTIKSKAYEKGNFKIDVANATFDLENEFKKKSKKGKEIIKNGYYEIKNKKYYEIYSLYFYSIEKDILKIYDVQDGIMIFNKEK